jgi:hypothetical protein
MMTLAMRHKMREATGKFIEILLCVLRVKVGRDSTAWFRDILCAFAKPGGLEGE